MPLGFLPSILNNGLDVRASPTWQMVPFREIRTLTVNGAGHGPKTLQPFPRDPTIVKAVQTGSGNRHRVLLMGLRVGKTIIDWLPPVPGSGQTAPTAQQLEISVKRERQVRTAFFYVDDGHSQVTSRSTADIDRLVTNINLILTRQSNVRVIKKSATALSVSQNLGSIVRFSSHLPGVAASEHEWDDLLTYRDPTADMNVFFVKEYEQDVALGRDGTEGAALAIDKTIVVEDSLSSPAAKILAHEFVHGLGYGAHSTSNKHLMANGIFGLGEFISRAEVNVINVSGT